MKWIQILTAFKLYCNLLMCQNITIFVVIWLCFLSLNFCWGGAKTSPIFNIWYRISHGIHELQVWRDIWNLKPICLILFKLFEIDAFIFGRIYTGHASTSTFFKSPASLESRSCSFRVYFPWQRSKYCISSS